MTRPRGRDVCGVGQNVAPSPSFSSLLLDWDLICGDVNYPSQTPARLTKTLSFSSFEQWFKCKPCGRFDVIAVSETTGSPPSAEGMRDPENATCRHLQRTIPTPCFRMINDNCGALPNGFASLVCKAVVQPRRDARRPRRRRVRWALIQDGAVVPGAGGWTSAKPILLSAIPSPTDRPRC